MPGKSMRRILWLGLPIRDWTLGVVACFAIILVAYAIGFGGVGGNLLFGLVGATIVTSTAMGTVVLFQLLTSKRPLRSPG